MTQTTSSLPPPDIETPYWPPNVGEQELSFEFLASYEARNGVSPDPPRATNEDEAT